MFLPHQCFTDQKSVRPRRTQEPEIVRRPQTAFGDLHETIRNLPDQLGGDRRIRAERLEVSAVHADDLRARRNGTRDLLARMRLNERLHPIAAHAGEQRRQTRIVQCRHDQQHGIRAAGPRAQHLVFGRDEVLEQDRQIAVRSRDPHILLAPQKLVRLRQNRKRRRARLVKLPRQVRRIEMLADESLRGTRLLQLGDHMDAVTAERRREIADACRPLDICATKRAQFFKNVHC